MAKHQNLERLTSEEHKLELLKLLKKADRFFKDNNIKYFLASGTALGAVRHGGFIPWDDDIDLIVPRPDYERLLSYLRQTDKGDLKYFELHDTKNYFYPFIKLYDGNVILKENTAKSTLFLNIDVFPLDYVPNDMEERKAFFAKAMRLKTYTFFRTNKIFYIPNRWKKSFLRFLSPLLWVVNIFMQPIINRRFLLRRYDKLLKQASQKTDYMMNLVWSLDAKQSNETSIFEESIDIMFEGEKYPIVKNYDAYLTALFGNYMRIPDEKDRVVHQMKSYRIRQK